ncbi:hypothetical protein EDD85DRAFT_339827 [Armillaria nabsnona]|nr:hypothetical protein EDD85DRAFT_339827 [Armillaria nabsnona]
MITANAEYGLFFAGFIAIAAQLVHSTDPSRPGRILLLSPIFTLHNETLPDPSPKEHLTPFQANIQNEPFLAIIVAMLCANILPGRVVESPPAHLCQLLPLDEMLNAENDDGDVDSFEEDSDGDEVEPSGIPECSLQVITNAMVLHHPWLNCRDIHRISVICHPPPPLSDVQNIPAKNPVSLTKSLSPSLMQPQNLLRAPRIASTHVDMVTLVDQIRAGRWSSIYTCHVEDDDKLHIMKLVSELHSVMVLRELYMDEVALKDSSLVPKFYGMFQRSVAGWFGLLLENVGDSLDEVYGPDWSDVKSSVSTTEWQRLIDSVIELHSLGVLHGDLEPRNVALTAEGFKFFDFGQSKMHHCQRDECYELQDLLDV